MREIAWLHYDWTMNYLSSINWCIVTLWCYILFKQAEKLKSREMKEGWMKNVEGWMMNDEGWWYQAVEGFWGWMNRQMDKQTNEHLWL